MAIDKSENTEPTEKPEKTEVSDSASAKKTIIVTDYTDPEVPEEEFDETEQTDLQVEDDSSESDETSISNEQPNEEDQPTVGDAIDAAKKQPEKTGEEMAASSTSSDALPNGNAKDDIDALVDDIVRTESTEQLAEADAKLAAAATPKKTSSIGSKLKSGLKNWWQTAWLRNTTIAIIVITLISLVLVPTTRYGLLNAFGVRVKSSMTVIDSQTRLPLKNITIKLQDKTAQTDKQGQVFFDELKLGNSQLAITKRGYANNERNITLGWGSNPIGDQEITATGEQFTFILVDWLSNERIIDAEATAGESSANSDDDGKIILTIDQGAIGEDQVIIRADGYRDEVIAPEDLNDADIEVVMVPNRRHAFVSNRNSKFDVYVIDLDGKNEELLVEATEKEREVPGIVQHDSNNTFALVSSRDGIENTDKYILDGLFIVDSESGEVQNIGRSERIQLLGWSGDSLVYTQVVEGTSRGNAERSKLFSFNNQTGEKIELAAANYFNDIELVGDTVTYAVSSFAVAQSRARLFSIKVNGDDSKQQLDKQVYTIFRTSQNELLFNAIDQKWFSQTGNEDLREVDPVLSPDSYKYSTSPDGSRVAWSDTRDGKGVLFISDRNGDNEKEVAVIPGLDSVEYWANNETIVYRVIKSEETADYVLHIEKPEDQRKIADVTASKRIFF